MHAILSIPFERPGSPKDIQQRTNLICASIERLARFCPQVIAIAPGTSGIADAPAGPVKDVVRALPQIADTAAECGLEVGLELLAHLQEYHRWTQTRTTCSRDMASPS
jgi:sugar phosphate isomerase/epimerase